MKIKRIVNGQERFFTLTDEELSKAHTEYVINFMVNTLQNDFDLEKKDAEKVAVIAYDLYCEGNGDTEYECIQKAYDEQRKIINYK